MTEIGNYKESFRYIGKNRKPGELFEPGAIFIINKSHFNYETT